MNILKIGGFNSIIAFTDEIEATPDEQAKQFTDFLYENMHGAVYDAIIKRFNSLDENGNGWVDICDAEHFHNVRLVMSCRALTPDEVQTVSGLLGYALASTICGDGLSQPTLVRNDGEAVVIDYTYDSTKSRRDDLHNSEALDEFENIIKNGSRIRTRPRAVAGTRKCEGLGWRPEDIKLYVK